MRAALKLSLPVLFAFLLAVQAAPAGAVAPAGYSVAFTDLYGSLLDCFEFRCGSQACWARAVYTGEWGKCTPIEEFEPGRTRLTCTYKDVRWSWWHRRIKEVVLDITCTRFGEAIDFIGGKYSPGPPLSCAAAVTYRRATRYETWSGSYMGLTLSGPRKCKKVFGSLTRLEWRQLEVWDYTPQ